MHSPLVYRVAVLLLASAQMSYMNLVLVVVKRPERPAVNSTVPVRRVLVGMNGGHAEP
jgi:hypothetical protein